jgi:uncharacterized membrane protein YuzA (DUF378 family)
VKKMSSLDWTAVVLLIAGGINWGLIGLLKFNFVEAFSVFWNLARACQVGLCISGHFRRLYFSQLVKIRKQLGPAGIT